MRLFASSNGLAGTNPNSRFLIAGNVYVTDKKVIPSAPPKISVKLEFVFHIADQETENIFASTNISASGIGNNDTQAFIQAIGSLNPKHQSIAPWIEKGKKEIISYYNSQCNFILAKAKTLADQQQYEAAIFTLTSIPEVCQECYLLAMRSVGPIYRDYSNLTCEKNLARAKSIWASDPSLTGARGASQYLELIIPGSEPCYSEAQILVREIHDKLRQDQILEWTFALKKWDDRVDLESQRIEAYRAVGIAYGSNLRPKISKTYIWLR